MSEYRPSTRGRGLALLLLLAALTTLLAARLAATPALGQTGAPRGGAPVSDCFGAAARDPRKPCRDPKLRTRAFPAPEDALLEPNARCTPTEQTAILLPCAFGVPKQDARAVVALVGDSHASHWRAAVEGVAQERGWRGISITRSGCPFSKAVARLDGDARAACVDWNRETLAWFSKHPEVNTVFVSQHRGGKVVTKPGAGNEATQIAGYRAVWDALPPTVTRIFVIRDTPRAGSGTADCVERAVSGRRAPGPTCALRRSDVLQPDPAARAARRAASSRVRLIDMTPYMCSSRLCLPVIGGALVHKDLDHLTQTFAATLGPYLARKVTALGVPGPPAG